MAVNFTKINNLNRSDQNIYIYYEFRISDPTMWLLILSKDVLVPLAYLPMSYLKIFYRTLEVSKNNFDYSLINLHAKREQERLSWLWNAWTHHLSPLPKLYMEHFSVWEMTLHPSKVQEFLGFLLTKLNFLPFWNIGKSSEILLHFCQGFIQFMKEKKPLLFRETSPFQSVKAVMTPSERGATIQLCNHSAPILICDKRV